MSDDRHIDFDDFDRRRLRDYEEGFAQKSQETAVLRRELAKANEELAYVRLQRDALLEMTWLDLPTEPSESTARWREEFARGWERKSVRLGGGGGAEEGRCASAAEKEANEQ